MLLVIPGIVLWLRWQVTAQAAAIEHEGWRQALRRSWSLTEANAIRVLLFLVCVGGITLVPWFLISQPFAHRHTTALAFLLATALRTLILSFTALATALLYYDLRCRREVLAASWGTEGPASPEHPDRRFDPRLSPRTSDEARRARRGLPG